jgi:uncharacterized protein
MGGISSGTSDVSGPGEDPSLAGEIEDLARRHGLAELYVFGSRAEEVAARMRGAGPEGRTTDSDVDVGVRPLRGQRLSAEALVEIAAALEELLGAHRVDVVLLPTAPPFLALDVIRGELLHCADPDEQAEYELYVLRRAGDLAPFQRIRQENALSRYLDR